MDLRAKMVECVNDLANKQIEAKKVNYNKLYESMFDESVKKIENILEQIYDKNTQLEELEIMKECRIIDETDHRFTEYKSSLKKLETKYTKAYEEFGNLNDYINNQLPKDRLVK